MPVSSKHHRCQHLWPVHLGHAMKVTGRKSLRSAQLEAGPFPISFVWQTATCFMAAHRSCMPQAFSTPSARAYTQSRKQYHRQVRSSGGGSAPPPICCACSAARQRPLPLRACAYAPLSPFPSWRPWPFCPPCPLLSRPAPPLSPWHTQKHTVIIMPETNRQLLKSNPLSSY
jgi:hypothetical protein